MREQKKSQYIVSNQIPKFRSQPIQELNMEHPFQVAKDLVGGMRGRNQQINQMNTPVGPGGDPYKQQARADKTATQIPQSRAGRVGQRVAQTWQGAKQAGGGLGSRIRGAVAGARAPVAGQQPPPAAAPTAAPAAPAP